MILKYTVPEQHRKRIYENKKVIYCEILQEQEIQGLDTKIYRVKMLNLHNFTNIISSNELQKLNILDKIKVRRYLK